MPGIFCMDIKKLLLRENGRKSFFCSDGILDFIDRQERDETAELTPETVGYQEKYQSSDTARAYNVRYQQKRIHTTRRESAILRKLLARYDSSEAVLDLPCGGGRLSSVIGEFAHTVVEMDLAPGQLSYGLKNCKTNATQIWIRASAFDIPLKDNSMDGVVCIRLSHHLYSLDEKEKLLSELLRVAKRFVIFYFVDSNAPKYTSRLWRARRTGSLRKINSMTVRELASMAEKLGGKITACPAAGFLQPHRYALIEKRPAEHN